MSRIIGMFVTAALLPLAAGAGVAAAQSCPGDFNRDSAVTTDEILRTVTFALKGCPNPNQRFIDNRDGTITDTKTGLMWEKKVASDTEQNASDLHDADNPYDWAGRCTSGNSLCQPDAASSAACFAGVEGDTTGCDECTGTDGQARCIVFSREDRPNVTIWQWLTALNAANFGGYSDWRIPTMQELVTILDVTTIDPTVDAAFHGARCGRSCNDVRDPECSCTASDEYWTSSSYFSEPQEPHIVYAVEFAAVGIRRIPKDPYLFVNVRAVRSGP